MFESNPDLPSTSYLIDTVADKAVEQQYHQTSKAFDYVIKARDINDRIVPTAEFRKCDSLYWVDNFSRAAGNVMLLGMNYLYFARSERLLVKAEYILGEDFFEHSKEDQ